MECPLTRSPPKDSEGCVVPHDHEQIHDADIMLRGIPCRWVIPTEKGRHRISSGAFQNSSESDDKYESLSLGSKKMLDFHNSSIDEWSNGRFCAVATFPASELRDSAIKVGWDPKDDDPAHCGAWGNLKKPLRKRLAKEVEWQYINPTVPPASAKSN